MTMKEATDFLIEDIMKEIGLNKTEARKALAKALNGYAVVKEIEDDIKCDLGIYEDEDDDPYLYNQY